MKSQKGQTIVKHTLDLFGDAHQWGSKKARLPKICHTSYNDDTLHFNT